MSSQQLWDSATSIARFWDQLDEPELLEKSQALAAYYLQTHQRPNICTHSEPDPLGTVLIGQTELTALREAAAKWRKQESHQ